MPQTSLHPLVHQALWSAVGSIPGCTPREIVHTTSATISSHAGAPLSFVEIHFDGWSPSLHRVPIRWRLPFDDLDGDEPADHVQHLLGEAHRPVAIQRARAAEGLALGEAMPIAIRRDLGQFPRVDHLHADASLLAFAVSNAWARAWDLPDAMLQTVGTCIAVLHDDTGLQHNGFLVHSDGSTAAREQGDERTVDFEYDIIAGETVQTYATTRYATRPRRAPSDGTPVIAILREGRLDIDGSMLPDTVVDILPGRPVSQVVPTATHLAHRTIRRVERSGNGFRLHFDPVPVAIAEVLAIGAAHEDREAGYAAAIAHLTALTAAR